MPQCCKTQKSISAEIGKEIVPLPFFNCMIPHCSKANCQPNCSRTNAENVSSPFYHVNRILYSNISIIIPGSSYNGSGCLGLWPPLLYCNSLMAHCYVYRERKSTIENSPVSGIVQHCPSPLYTGCFRKRELWRICTVPEKIFFYCNPAFTLVVDISGNQ